VVDEKHRNITVTDEGWEKVEKLLGIGNIADPENWDLKHHVETAVKAHALYKRDVEYVVKDGEVIIVDEFTGRLMPGAAGPTACTRRSKPREREDRARESDARHHHLPELFPHVQEAGRHDRHGGNRSARIRQDLPARSRRDSDQRDAAQWRIPTSSTARRKKNISRPPTRSRSCTTANSRCWSARLRSKSPSGCPNC
jgi:hypothetical protein